VNVPRQRKVERGLHRRFRTVAIGGLALWLVGCATSQNENIAPTDSVQTVQYYPFQVKGYENTYPKRRVVVLSATDNRDFKDVGDVNHEPNQGHPAIGTVVNQQGKVIQRLYGPTLEVLIQQAVAHAATEAGMIATTTILPLKQELTARRADYVITIKILRCWVTKSRGPDRPDGPNWHAASVVTLEAAVYKPPFEVAFWQGQVSATYTDPPTLVNGVSLDEEAEIYDQPGEVLSVALTRAVAEIFKRDDLHTLIDQDTIRVH
jgi:hypothetical protein